MMFRTARNDEMKEGWKDMSIEAKWSNTEAFIPLMA